MHSEGETVRVSIESVFPFGIFVRLEDGANGYIRRRELTLSGDVDPRDVVSVGDTLIAVITRPAGADAQMELSVKAARPDPWHEFIDRFREGDIVAVVKRNLKVDWTRPHREDVRSAVLAAVKMVLRKRKVRKEDFDLILHRVIAQAEALYEDWPLAV